MNKKLTIPFLIGLIGLTSCSVDEKVQVKEGVCYVDHQERLFGIRMIRDRNPDPDKCKKP